MIQSAKQRIGPEASLYYVSTNVPAAAQAAHQSGERAGPVTPLNDDTSARGQSRDGSDVDGALTALYREHALSLIRLAHVMLGDKATAEDVVQEAFCGLYRHWGQLSDPRKAPQYLRASVLNGCRTAIRRDRSARQLAETESTATSAEAAALASEQQRIVLHAIRGLPDRQREALVLRFYLDESDAEIARLMGVRQSTVRSTTHRALAALGRSLGENS